MQEKFRYETTAAAALDKVAASLKAAALDIDTAAKHLRTPALLVALADVSKVATPADMRINSLAAALLTEGVAEAAAKVESLKWVVATIEVEEGGEDE